MKETKSMTGKCGMPSRALLVLGMAVVFGGTTASAQSLKGMFKKAKESFGEQVKKEATKNIEKALPIKTATKTTTKHRSITPVKKSGGKTIDIPRNHTALFAPIGKAVDAKLGIRTVKQQKPPQDEKKQPAWNDAQVPANELDNKSLVEAYKLMEECLDSKYVSRTSPASFRHLSLYDELNARTRALNYFVERYNDAMDTYEDEDMSNDNANRTFAGTLKTDAYKTVIRSSIAPLLTLSDNFVSDDVKEYFKEHGGGENAHKAKLTVWNPDR